MVRDDSPLIAVCHHHMAAKERIEPMARGCRLWSNIGPNLHRHDLSDWQNIKANDASSLIPAR